LAQRSKKNLATIETSVSKRGDEWWLAVNICGVQQDDIGPFTSYESAEIAQEEEVEIFKCLMEISRLRS
jgi:hypothetical protein